MSAVDFARRSGLTVSIRGGGHHYAGLAVWDDALMVDLSPMKAIRVDSEGEQALRPLRELGIPTMDRVRPMSYVALRRLTDEALPDEPRGYAKTEWLRGLPGNVIDALVAGAAEAPSPITTIHLQQMGGAMGRVPEADTGFGYRKAAHHLGVVGLWPREAPREPTVEWVRSIWAGALPASAGGGYSANLMDRDRDRVRASYGPAYARLARDQSQVRPGQLLPDQPQHRAGHRGGRDVTARFGLTLSNRGVLTGATTVDEMLRLAEYADRDPRWHSVWVGDSILAKPRLDAICTLSALAVRTQRLKMGAACMASTPLRQPLVLAYQWASLDFLSGGRTIFVACQGQPGPGGGDFEGEFAALGVEPSSRMRRMEEVVEILRLLSTHEVASYEGEYYHFEDVTISPSFVTRPLPIWITANPDLRKPQNVESALRRVARLGDGYMTASHDPAGTARCLHDLRRYAADHGRELGPDFAVCLYFNVNVGEDVDRARDETVKYLARKSCLRRSGQAAGSSTTLWPRRASS